ncbi:DUF6193 family natural product biosynthesis protein [Streptomyces sp. NPDC087917]|uniref:DUF6193 family natural product biosynthesis protein n=1 Tax=unclassified Streptomyces TaxID=2593676 RepID=UPI003447025E
MSSPTPYPAPEPGDDLPAAVERLAGELGVALRLVPDRWGAANAAGIAASVPGREPLFVEFVVGEESRWFDVSGRSEGVQLVTGGTTDLREVIAAGVAWGRGASLREMREQLPFLRFDELAEAHERGPADAVDVRWRRMLEEVATEWSYPGFRPLLEAAHASPELRRLYPFASHWMLCFSACTGYPYAVKAAVWPLKGGRYAVQRGMSQSSAVGEADTVAEAVALAVSQLPSGLGPAVAGSADRDG